MRRLQERHRTHLLHPAEALRLADTLGVLPARVAIWVVEGQAFDPLTGLDPTVAAAIPELVRRIGDELEPMNRCRCGSPNAEP